MILEETLRVAWHGLNRKHYESLGYKYTQRGDVFEIKIEHLPPKSNEKVTQVCDECGAIVPNQVYSMVQRQRTNGDGKDRCSDCGKKFNAGKVKDRTYKNPLVSYAKANKKEYLLKEYSDKNEVSLDKIAHNSNRDSLWNCLKCGSEYNTKVYLRIRRGTGCPYCARKKVNHTNCLWTTHPEIAKFLKNPNRGYEILSGTKVKETFKCLNCPFEKDVIVRDVVKYGFSCPICSENKD